MNKRVARLNYYLAIISCELNDPSIRLLLKQRQRQFLNFSSWKKVRDFWWGSALQLFAEDSWNGGAERVFSCRCTLLNVTRLQICLLSRWLITLISVSPTILGLVWWLPLTSQTHVSTIVSLHLILCFSFLPVTHEFEQAIKT